MRSINDLEGSYKLTSDGTLIQLQWTHIWKNEPAFLGYRLYHNLPPGTDLHADHNRPLYDSGSIQLKMNHFFSRTILFAVKAALSNNLSTPISNVLPLLLPTFQLPAPRITRAYTVRGHLAVEWMFPLDIPDLSGFILYHNSTEVPIPIMKYQRSLLVATEALGPGVISLRAVSNFDSLSPYSKSFSLK